MEFSGAGLHDQAGFQRPRFRQCSTIEIRAERPHTDDVRRSPAFSVGFVDGEVDTCPTCVQFAQLFRSSVVDDAGEFFVLFAVVKRLERQEAVKMP